MFICPNCNTRLTNITSEAGIFWSCPGCNGRAVSLSVLKKVIPEKESTQLWQDARSALAGNRACPSCNHPMKIVQLNEGQTPLYLDICTGCYFIWFDPEEFETVSHTDSLTTSPEAASAKVAEAKAEVAIAAMGRKTEYEISEIPDHWWEVLLAVFGFPVEYDTVGVAGRPVITWALSGLMILVFFATVSQLNSIAEDWGLVPAYLYRHFGANFIASFLLHAGFVHLLGNLYFFLVFGDNVEEALGWRKYLMLIVFAAILGDAVHILADPRLTMPLIGASGGISGIMVYYALQFPRNRIGILFFYRWYRIPVGWMLALWFAAQLLGVLKQISGIGNVSALGHLGGAAAGVLFWLYFRQYESSRKKEEQAIPQL